MTAQSYLRGATADEIESLESDYREQVGRDLEYDMRGFSPIPHLSVGPGCRVKLGDGLRGQELDQTLDLLHAPEAQRKVDSLTAILAREIANDDDFKALYSRLRSARVRSAL